MLCLNKNNKFLAIAAVFFVMLFTVGISHVNAQSTNELEMEMQRMDLEQQNLDSQANSSNQTAVNTTEVAAEPREETPEEKEARRKATAAKLLAEVKAKIYTSSIPGFSASLFLTPLELLTLERALSGKSATLGGEGKEAPKRVIDVDGLLYNSSNSWIVWINGKRLTPGYLLPEIVGIHVKRDSVYLEWFDSVFNKIITINMRPHQVYDIQSGILLPG